MTGANDRTEVIRFRIEPAIKEQFEQICAAQDRLVSQVLREFVRDYLREHRHAELLPTPKRGRK